MGGDAGPAPPAGGGGNPPRSWKTSPKFPTQESPPFGFLKKRNWELQSKFKGDFKVGGGENIVTTSPCSFFHNYPYNSSIIELLS